MRDGPFGQVDFRRLNIKRPFFCHITQNILERTLYAQLSRLGVRSITASCCAHSRIRKDGIPRHLRRFEWPNAHFSRPTFCSPVTAATAPCAACSLRGSEQTYAPTSCCADVESRATASPGETHYFLCRGVICMVVPIPRDGTASSCPSRGSFGERTSMRSSWRRRFARRVGMRSGSQMCLDYPEHLDIACRAGTVGECLSSRRALHQFQSIGEPT